MKCPNCLTENPASARRCDCGYDFKELEATRVAERIEKGVKLYSKNNIIGSAFFGGPLAPGYLISRNFKGLGNEDAARNALLIASGVTILLVGVLPFLIPEQIWDQIPNFLLPFVIWGIAGSVVKKFQEEKIAQHIKEGGQTASWVNALGVCMVSLLVAVGIFFVGAFFAGDLVEDKVVFGQESIKRDVNEDLLGAARYGTREAIQFFLEAGADVNAVDPSGVTALMLAVILGNAETVQALLEAGADEDITIGGGPTAFMLAALVGNTEIVQIFLEAGTDVNHKNNDGMTALMFASEGQTETVRVLLDAGADVNAENNDSGTALMVAEDEGHTEIVELLKKAGAQE